MDTVTVEGRAAGQLLAEKELLAESVTRSLYEEMPELSTRYGPAGREKCLQDLRFTIEHLIPAVKEIIDKIDFSNRTVTIDPPAGLLDL